MHLYAYRVEPNLDDHFLGSFQSPEAALMAMLTSVSRQREAANLPPMSNDELNNFTLDDSGFPTPYVMRQFDLPEGGGLATNEEWLGVYLKNNVA